MLKAIVYFLLAGTLTGATGNVVYTGTPIGNMNQYGSALANAFDRDLTTESYGSNSAPITSAPISAREIPSD